MPPPGRRTVPWTSGHLTHRDARRALAPTGELDRARPRRRKKQSRLRIAGLRRLAESESHCDTPRCSRTWADCDRPQCGGARRCPARTSYRSCHEARHGRQDRTAPIMPTPPPLGWSSCRCVRRPEGADSRGEAIPRATLTASVHLAAPGSSAAVDRHSRTVRPPKGRRRLGQRRTLSWELRPVTSGRRGGNIGRCGGRGTAPRRGRRGQSNAGHSHARARAADLLPGDF